MLPWSSVAEKQQTIRGLQTERAKLQRAWDARSDTFSQKTEQQRCAIEQLEEDKKTLSDTLAQHTEQQRSIEHLEREKQTLEQRLEEKQQVKRQERMREEVEEVGASEELLKKKYVAPRTFKITKEDVEKHGYTGRCPGCSSWLRRGRAKDTHTHTPLSAEQGSRQL